MTKIGKNAFKECKNLKKISLPENLEIIGEFSFSSSLIELAIQNSAKVIGKRASSGCLDLAAVQLPEAYIRFQKNVLRRAVLKKYLCLRMSI